MIQVKVKRVSSNHLPPLPLPSYQTPHAVGMDLLADVENPLSLEPGERRLVPTGIAIELPEGFEAQIRPRSGLAVKKGVTLLNSPGTIDSDYRGEIRVILVNHGHEPIVVGRGDRIAQMVVAPALRAALVESAEISETKRSVNGFGSTGEK